MKCTLVYRFYTYIFESNNIIKTPDYGILKHIRLYRYKINYIYAY